MATYEKNVEPPHNGHQPIDRFLNSLTKYVSKPLGFNKMYNNQEQLKRKEMEYASSLPLQMALYFNSFYALVWVIGTSFFWPLLIERSVESTRVWIILILFAFIIMVIFEIIRLYLGYVGNLSERVPELTGFWLLTLMVATPLSLFLTVIVWVPIGGSGVNFVIAQYMPMQFALQLIHTIFALVEVILGFFALRLLARYQIARFHYKQFDVSNDVKYNYDDNDLAKDNDWLNNLDKGNNINMKTFNYKTK